MADARDFIMPGERPEPALSCRCARCREAASVAPHVPFAIPFKIGSVGWEADIRTRFLRELSDSFVNAGTAPRNS
jgi:hypothetical protein